MKTFFNTLLLAATVVFSGTTIAMTDDSYTGAIKMDASHSLEMTLCSVYADLQKNIESSIRFKPGEQYEGFGIDDTDSYSPGGSTSLSQLQTES